ncbi:chemotaxis protein CheW [Maridesulfovibrio hydrothermalis]|uniref:Chemotaxis protein CheW n=1 Tax=Maridesulfovibrio hydrothermalis AM13 = DSM 14728 TaxID=1121451 RepID=L0RC51_9BACT|nr:chemotaxis protein CheW [Maridesulfovibrio hydrothermalis]CCO23136.1 CheW protein [Maridesulfovibrio hydrothermalis AM13 = DSM 14728]
MDKSCWNEIGYAGDRSCPELQKWSHCYNCSQFTSAGLSLLHREPPEGYLAENTQAVATVKEEDTTETAGAVVFRISREWLALSSQVFVSVLEKRAVRPVPHRNNKSFRGLTSIQGQIVPVVSVRDLLSLEQEYMSDAEKGFRVFSRFICVDRGFGRWVFAADEVLGVHHYFSDGLLEAPATVAKAPAAYTRGLFEIGDKRISLLEDELLFEAFNRIIK